MVRPEDEILIIDDGSTDGTAEKLFKYSNSDSRFRVIPSGGIGLVGSLNLGLSIASNKYAARFDVDDRYEIERLSVQREALFSNPVAVFSDYECWNSTFTRSLGCIPSAVTPEGTYLSLISSTRTPHPSVIFNVSAAKDVGGYLSEDFLAEDLSLWLRIAAVGKIISIPKTLLHYRLGQGSLTNMNQIKMRQKKTEMLKSYPIPKYIYEFVLENIPEIFVEYDTYENSERRKLLLILDLFIYEKNFVGKSVDLPKFITKYIGSHFLPIARETLLLVHEKYLRSRNR